MSHFQCSMIPKFISSILEVVSYIIDYVAIPNVTCKAYLLICDLLNISMFFIIYL